MRMDSIRNFGYKVAEGIGYGIRKAIPHLLVSYAIVSLGSHNGCFDSNRAIEAAKRHDVENPIKTVLSVEEEWRDNSEWAAAASVFGGGGYNPHVIRTVTFDDGSEASLDYRTEAWQPMRRWVKGEEFNPKPGEKYEVVSGKDVFGGWVISPQQLVRKVE